MRVIGVANEVIPLPWNHPCDVELTGKITPFRKFMKVSVREWALRNQILAQEKFSGQP
jgi:hypothetical protein